MTKNYKQLVEEFKKDWDKDLGNSGYITTPEAFAEWLDENLLTFDIDGKISGLLEEQRKRIVKDIEERYQAIPKDKTDNGRMKESEWDYAEGWNKALDWVVKKLK